MIVTKMRGSKKHITSSSFDDIAMLRSAEVDTCYRERYRDRKESIFPTDALQLSFAIQKLILFKKGCYELSTYVNGLSLSQLTNITTDYLGEYFNDV